MRLGLNYTYPICGCKEPSSSEGDFFRDKVMTESSRISIWNTQRIHPFLSPLGTQLSTSFLLITARRALRAVFSHASATNTLIIEINVVSRDRFANKYSPGLNACMDVRHLHGKCHNYYPKSSSHSIRSKRPTPVKPPPLGMGTPRDEIGEIDCAGKDYR